MFSICWVNWQYIMVIVYIWILNICTVHTTYHIKISTIFSSQHLFVYKIKAHQENNIVDVFIMISQTWSVWKQSRFPICKTQRIIMCHAVEYQAKYSTRYFLIPHMVFLAEITWIFCPYVCSKIIKKSYKPIWRSDQETLQFLSLTKVNFSKKILFCIGIRILQDAIMNLIYFSTYAALKVSKL